MRELSITTFWLALIATAGGVFFYWGYAFGGMGLHNVQSACANGGTPRHWRAAKLCLELVSRKGGRLDDLA
jgi:hypothetical protein